MTPSRPPRERATTRGAVAIVTLAILLVAAGSALAHDTWLLPATLRVPVGQAVTLSLTSGMAFPADDLVVQPSRIKRAEARLGGKTSTLLGGQVQPRALQYTWTPSESGIAALVVELAPKTLTLTPDKVAEYLDEIDAPKSIRATWARIPSPKRWRERYTKHAATFVRVGSPQGDSSWARPMGLGLEMVPERDPTTLVAGDTLVVRVMRGATPLAGFVVGSRYAGAPNAIFWPTDTRGRARVVLPKAGTVLLAGTDLRRSTKPNLEWESDFATMTLAVQPK